jgi:hypothetical protein
MVIRGAEAVGSEGLCWFLAQGFVDVKQIVITIDSREEALTLSKGIWDIYAHLRYQGPGRHSRDFDVAVRRVRRVGFTVSIV